MRIKEIPVYEFSELSETAKARAIEKHREFIAQDWDAEYILSDAAHVGGLLGIDFKQNVIKLASGKTRYEPAIYYSGFYMQGSGACFEGVYTHQKGSRKAVREYAPQDKELYRIATVLTAVQFRHGFRLTATVKHFGHYVHACNTDIDVAKINPKTLECIEFPHDDAEVVIRELRAFMQWIYAQLETEYEYRMSDESIIESIEANEYEFLENGRIA